jgi:hypothetical protein
MFIWITHLALRAGWLGARCCVHCFARCLGLALAGLAATVQAALLSFEQAMTLALHKNPALVASAAKIDAARQAAIPAGALPDPKPALGIDNVPIDGADRFNLGRDFMTMRRISVMQEVPNRAKRHAREAVAQGRTEVAEAEARIVRLTVQSETAVAWINRYTVERQLQRIDALFSENRLLDAAVRARFAGGLGRADETVAPRQEPRIAAKRAERAALDAERETMLREHAARLAGDLAEYERLSRAVARQRTVLLPLANEKAALVLAAWRGGKGSLSDVINVRRDCIDAELKTITLEGERWQMAARLHFAYDAPTDAPMDAPTLSGESK